MTLLVLWGVVKLVIEYLLQRLLSHNLQNHTLQYSKSISSHSFFATRLILYIYVPKHIVLNLTGGIFDIFSETIFFNTLYIENCKFFGFFSIYILFFYFYKNIENSQCYFLDNGSRKINVQFEPCSLKTVGGDRF